MHVNEHERGCFQIIDLVVLVVSVVLMVSSVKNEQPPFLDNPLPVLRFSGCLGMVHLEAPFSAMAHGMGALYSPLSSRLSAKRQPAPWL